MLAKKSNSLSKLVPKTGHGDWEIPINFMEQTSIPPEQKIQLLQTARVSGLGF